MMSDIETKVIIITEKTGLWFLAKQVLEDNDFHSTGKKQYKLLSWFKEKNAGKFGEDDYIFIGSEFLIPKNEYSVACIIGNDISGHGEQETLIDTVKWIDNGDGSYTALAGATLWELAEENVYDDGRRWVEFGYTGDSENLQIGEIVYPMETVISYTESEIQPSATHCKLSGLVKTNTLANLMLGNYNNPDYIDRETQLGIGNKNPAELSQFLDDLNVYHVSVSNWSKITSALTNLQMNIPVSFIDMLSVGNNIYVKDTISLTLPLIPNIANLLGHETIHCLQATGMGKIDFFNKYKKENSDYGYPNNKFEKPAYNWGGDSNMASVITQLLILNANWW
jgi:hypothetical protein